MEYLTTEDILRIHSATIDETGGSHGVREHGALATLEALPKQGAFGSELYATVFDKAAVYARNIILGHPFIDGNKRTAMATADVFLQLNGYRITVAKGGIESFALSIIENKMPLNQIAQWLKRNSKRIR